MTHTPHRKKKRPFRVGRRLLAATLFGALLALLLVRPAAAEAKPWSGRIADAYAGGTGTPDDPYRIATGDQLARLAQRVNEGEDAKDADAHYLLVADIDLIGGPLRNWTPIGAHETRPFGGVLDGGGHAIVGLWVVGGDEETDYAYASAGLFGRVHGDEAAIRNLVLTDVRIDVRASGRETSIAAGALAGSFYGAGGIENVSAQGAIVVRAADAAYALPGVTDAGVFIHLPLPRLDIRAELIRERLLAGRSARFLVPDSVHAILENHPEAMGIWRS
jgi:Nicotinic acid mononucleotide adenylyltransferase